MRYKRILLGLLLVTPPAIQAQTNHYWSQQFGGASSLLGGAVVGSVRDASAAYYNPGALAFLPENELSASADAYGWGKLYVKDAVGPGSNISATDVSVYPTLIAGTLRSKNNARHVFAYSLLTRTRFSISTSGRRDERVNVLNDVRYPGAEDYIGQYSEKGDVTELWGGLSWSMKLSDRMAFGVSGFLGYLNHNYLQTVAIRAITDNLDVALTDLNGEIDFYSLYALAKIGLAMELDSLKLGLAYTTGNSSLYGNGTVAVDYSVINEDFNNDGIAESFVANDRQENLDAIIKRPQALSLGGEYPLNDDTKLVFTVEHFFALNRYDVVQPEPRDFVRPPGIIDQTSRDFIGVSQASKAVTNYAVGLQYKYSPTIKVLTGFRTDFAAKPPDKAPALEPLNTSWDLYHLSGGLMWTRKDAKVVAGLTYSFSLGSKVDGPVNFSQPSEENFLAGPNAQATANYSALQFIFGYTKNY